MKPRATVFVIEDNAPLRAATQLFLELDGYTVVTQQRASDALDSLRGGAKADVILLDLMMPGTDGFQFREEQLADPTLAHIPLVVWTGQFLSPTHIERLRGAAVLPKPADPETVLQTIATLLRRQ